MQHLVQDLVEISFGGDVKNCVACLGRIRLALTLILVVSAVGCAVNPATGERQLALISETQEIALGEQTAEQVRQTMALVEDPELQAYVERLGQELAAASERAELPWSFAVVDDPTPNAFALPGGPVFVTRGLLVLMDSEAELVSVLGHEIGHITARHSVAQISRAQLAQLGLGLGAIFVPEIRPFGDVAGLGLNLLMLKYGRDAERQADELGFRYARSQGYDVSEMADVFAALQRAGELAGQSAIPNWMATHPAPEERIEAVQRRLRNMPAKPLESTVGRAEFLGVIEGLAYGENPRNGFFRDDVYYHPDLRFRFAVPGEWQRQNLARAVVGISPAQNAAFQFSLAPAETAAEAMHAFAAQQGLDMGGTTSDRINGLPAVSAAFRAQAQEGVVAGYITFYEHDEGVYQLVTYSTAEVFEDYRGSFEAMIQSFAPVSDPAVLNVQPARVEIARLPRAMSLAEFAGWSESTIPLEELALINQIQDPQTTIDAGTLLKQVRGGIGKE
jgi:predicted Zn-dependent protease